MNQAVLRALPTESKQHHVHMGCDIMRLCPLMGTGHIALLPSDKALYPCKSAAIWDSFGHKGAFFLGVHHYTKSLLSVTRHLWDKNKIHSSRPELIWHSGK